jgi:CBS domain-containing protein
MRDENVGSLPVVEDGRLVGMITDRDIVVRVVAVGARPSNGWTKRSPRVELGPIANHKPVRGIPLSAAARRSALRRVVQADRRTLWCERRDVCLIARSDAGR